MRCWGGERLSATVFVTLALQEQLDKAGGKMSLPVEAAYDFEA
jgi:hypothetical protein